MFVDLPDQLILYSAGAFLLGWLLSSIGSRISDRHRARKRDPRDDRIRELEAELRIAQSEKGKSMTELERLEAELKETTVGIERRDTVITSQQAKLERMQSDLKDSVLKDPRIARRAGTKSNRERLRGGKDSRSRDGTLGGSGVDRPHCDRRPRLLFRA